MTTDITALTIDPTDLQSMADAVAVGVTTPERLADWIGVDLVEDCLVLDGSPVFADDGNAECEYNGSITPAAAAQQYVEDGDWGIVEKTGWVTVYTYRKGINEDGAIVHIERESHTITLDPEEPDCVSGESHVWGSPLKLVGGCKENPGVQGHGGGVVITECCMICGCQKKTDTWAQNPSNGEQGLESIEYSEGEYTDAVNEMHIERAKEALDTEAEQTGEYAFEWVDSDGDAVGADDDDLIEYGIALLVDPDATKITGTLLSSD